MKKIKPAKPGRSAGKSANRNLSPEESNTLVTLFTQGRYTEAATLARLLTVRFPQSEIGWKVLALTLSQLGRSAEALAPMQQAAALSPGDAAAHCNLGTTLKSLERLDEAEASYRRALEIEPDFPEAHYNLGTTLKNLQRLEEAEASYRRALAIRPDFAEAHYNLGNALKDLGRPDDAEASYRKALALRPGFADAHFNLGSILQDLGRPEETEACYRRALDLKPDHVEALNAHAGFILARHHASNDLTTALALIVRSLHVRDSREAKSLFASCVKRISFEAADEVFRDLMVRALSEPWDRPVDLAPAAINIISLDPDVGGCIGRADQAWPRPLDEQALYGSAGLMAVGSDDLLCTLLNSAPVCDIGMERFLTMARRAMLEAAAEMTASGGEPDAALVFYSSLARQCFINEYVFSHTNEEIGKAGELRDVLLAKLEAGSRVPALWLLAVASYFPLGSLPLAARLLETQWPEAVAAVLEQQVLEPEEERQLRATIPRLTPIDNAVSLLVQSQYEENPYPRWVKAGPAGKAWRVVDYLCQKYPLAALERHDKGGSIDVLIAGCGTGQHAIQSAQQFPGAKVLAVDLSLSSLGYAKRKTQELGLASIDYAQADLLKLGSLGRNFDVIESSGVLHHLADPWTGWQVLLSLLRPGGFMKLGFYSEVARRQVVRIRELIAGQGCGATPDEIRRFRQDLVASDKGVDFGSILKSSDFFSVSACRDMLFHVQEQRMTLTGIETFLQENHLTFLGLVIRDEVIRAYKLRFPDDPAATHVGQWQIFENENPDIFLGMYQFWIQKAACRGT